MHEIIRQSEVGKNTLQMCVYELLLTVDGYDFDTTVLLLNA